MVLGQAAIISERKYIQKYVNMRCNELKSKNIKSLLTNFAKGKTFVIKGPCCHNKINEDDRFKVKIIHEKYCLQGYNASNNIQAIM